MVSTNIDLHDEGTALALDAIGSIVVVGYSNGSGVMDDFTVVRYLNDLGIGMDEIKAGSIEVFPNPARERLVLRVPVNVPIQTIDLFGVAGDLVVTYPGQLRVLSLEGVGPGVHLLKVAGPLGTRTFRIVVQ